MADDCAAVLDASGVHHAHVFGISLGGMVAQELALRHPGRVDRLVLGATTMGGPQREPTPTAAVLTILRALRMPVDDQIRITAPWVLDAQAIARRPAIVDEWIAIAKSEPRYRRSIVGQLLAAAGHDTSQRLHRITAPTLVLTGDRDRLIPMGNSRQLASTIPGAKLELIAGAGHDFPAEQPEETARLLTAFLSPRAGAEAERSAERASDRSAPDRSSPDRRAATYGTDASGA
jgi:3-oxoadipate enol-lactonase